MPRLLAALLCLISLTAFAQHAPPRKEARPQVVQRIDFDEDGILGDTQGPDLDLHLARPAAKFESLLKVRTNFNKELLESVHSL